MDDNAITRIDRRAFMNLDHLRILNLRGNKLAFISDEAFQNLPELEELDLAYNQMKTFDFGSLDQVSMVLEYCVLIGYYHKYTGLQIVMLFCFLSM